MNRQCHLICKAKSAESVAEKGAGWDSAWQRKKAVTLVPGQLVQKGFEQQVITPTFVSALPEPDNRLR